MPSSPLGTDEALSSPHPKLERGAQITPVKRRSSARLSQTPQQRTPSLTDSPIPVLTPPISERAPRETPRKTPRRTRQNLVTIKGRVSKPAIVKNKRKKALSTAYGKDETLNTPTSSRTGFSPGPAVENVEKAGENEESEQDPSENDTIPTSNVTQA